MGSIMARSSGQAALDAHLGGQCAVHRALVGDLPQSGALLGVQRAVEDQLDLDPVDAPLARLALGAIRRVDLGMRQADLDRGERPLLPSRIQRDRHRGSGSQRDEQIVVGRRAGVGPARRQWLVRRQPVPIDRHLLGEAAGRPPHDQLAHPASFPRSDGSRRDATPSNGRERDLACPTKARDLTHLWHASRRPVWPPPAARLILRGPFHIRRRRVSHRAMVETVFESVMSTHHGEIFRYLRRLAWRANEADDLSQETFLRAYRAWPRLTEDANVRAWLFTIATNVYKNH